MVKVLCPNSSLTVVMSMPAMIRCDAKVCLRLWKWKSLISSLRAAGTQMSG